VGGAVVATKALWQTKSIEQSIADTDEPDTRLRRNLGALDLTVFGVAVSIGAGIFVLAAQQAGDTAGPAVSLAYLLAAIACGFAVLCYAELASTVPVAGSAYTYSYATFGELIAWITVDWAALLIVGALTVILALGIKLSSRVSQLITAIKVAVVLLVIAVGIGYINVSNYRPYIPSAKPNGGEAGLGQSLFSVLFGSTSSTYGIFGVLAAASVVFFAFIGFDVVATTAEEARNPQRDMPRGIIGSLGDRHGALRGGRPGHHR
jgi:APA family basic amino acid/polyamine antiporter